MRGSIALGRRERVIEVERDEAGRRRHRCTPLVGTRQRVERRTLPGATAWCGRSWMRCRRPHRSYCLRCPLVAFEVGDRVPGRRHVHDGITYADERSRLPQGFPRRCDRRGLLPGHEPNPSAAQKADVYRELIMRWNESSQQLPSTPWCPLTAGLTLPTRQRIEGSSSTNAGSSRIRISWRNRQRRNSCRSQTEAP